MKKHKMIYIALASLLVVTTACSSNNSSTSSSSSTTSKTSSGTSASTVNTSNSSSSTEQFGSYADEDTVTDWDESTATKITLSDTTATVDGDGAKVSGSTVTISTAGTYVISGTLTDGQIIISANKDSDVVRIVLNGVDISNSSTSPIYVEQAKKAIVTLADGTENTIEDSSDYTFADATTDEPDAPLFSKADLTLNGSGKLTVKANYNNGIRSKDNIVITGGTCVIDAVNNAIKGKDSVSILDGNFTLTSGGDAIQSNNTDDTTLGWIAIDGGTYKITSGNDGVQAETDLKISNGTFDITSGDGTTSTDSTSDSYKGLKSGNSIIINDGEFNINSADDTVHSNGDVTINGGTLTLNSGDDGVHSDTTLKITGGTINVEKSYEGLEGAVVSISGGDIIVNASDDGINAAGGSDGTDSGGGFGQDNFSSDTDSYYIEITGGTTKVIAGGDGLDSNGNITMSGGTVLVDGPTDNGNGALDYDGTFDISGGILIAAGSSGMPQTTSDSSTQASLAVQFSSSQKEDSLISIASSDGTVIATYAPSKSYQFVVISTPEIKSGETYTVSSGGTSTGTDSNGLYTDGTYSGGSELFSTKLSSVVTTVSDSGETVTLNSMGGGPGGGGKQGGNGTPPGK